MTYIIAEPRIDIKDKSCVDVCPVDILDLARDLKVRTDHVYRDGRDVGLRHGERPPEIPTKSIVDYVFRWGAQEVSLN
ncbi:MAG TPA: hypothetical protein VF877_07285 [Gaiellaceae bacterium]